MRKNYNLNLHDGSTLSRAPLTDMFKTMRSTIIEELKSVKSITLLFDGCTDKYCEIPFMVHELQLLTLNGIRKYSHCDVLLYLVIC